MIKSRYLLFADNVVRRKRPSLEPVGQKIIRESWEKSRVRTSGPGPQFARCRPLPSDGGTENGQTMIGDREVTIRGHNGGDI